MIIRNKEYKKAFKHPALNKFRRLDRILAWIGMKLKP
jgi:hypothetical protein